MNTIPIYKPYLHPYKTSAIDAINSEWISNHGKYITLATNKLQEMIGVKHVILTNNGTTATHCLFLALRHKYPDIKKIYVPNNVYVAVYNCALMSYPIDSLEVLKINEDTWNMEENEEYLTSLEKDSAIVIVHNLGGIIDVDRIKRIRPDIILVEDNCEGLFGKYNNKLTGSSDSVLCTSVSFYGNKTITSGEGGAFLTNDTDVYKYIKKVYTQGMTEQRFVHDVHAYNYRMTNIQAAFLYDQLCDIDTVLDMKKNVFNNYETLLENEINENKISLQWVHNNCERANWMFAVKLNNNTMTVDELELHFTKCNGVEIRPFFYPFNAHRHLKNVLCNHDLELSSQLNQNVIMLPSYPELTIDEQKRVVNTIKNMYLC